MTRDIQALRILDEAAMNCLEYIKGDIGAWVYGPTDHPAPEFSSYEAGEAYRIVASARDRLLGFRLSPFV